jgi:ATP-dependent DNA helicase RecQ
VVFADRTLLEIATHRPLTLPAFAAIHGVGDAKLARYGETFVAIVQQFAASDAPAG